MATKIGLAEYREQDYLEILRLSEDRDKMEPTWKEWKITQQRAIRDFKHQGIKTVNVIVKPAELLGFCITNGLAINGQSRSKFVTYKL